MTPSAPGATPPASSPTREPSPCADAVTAIDTFIRTLRHYRSPSHLLSALEQFLALQCALNDAAHSLATGQLPPEPLRSNYRARLQTLAFELHRIEPLLQQEHTRLYRNLHHSSVRHSWLETLSQTQ